MIKVSSPAIAKEAISEALAAAHAESLKYYHEELQGIDQYPCGFAWVSIYENGNSPVGKALKSVLGPKKQYSSGAKAYGIWNPGNLPVQNVDAKVAGAQAAAWVLREKYGLKAYAQSRWD